MRNPLPRTLAALQRGFGCFLLLARFALRRFFLLAASRGDALVELIDTSCRIDEFLLSREERVARRADLDRDLRHGRTGDKGVAAGAVDPCFWVPFRVNLRFHSSPIVTDGATRAPLTGKARWGNQSKRRIHSAARR